jgi:predicted phosphodiesterase
MKLAFDLISDLHIESWDRFNWRAQATSPVCVVAGDVTKDLKILSDTLEHLSECYQTVLYIDGNDEHKHHWNSLDQNYTVIGNIIDRLDGVVFLQNNVVIINGVAFLGTNGWWTWDFLNEIDPDQMLQWFMSRTQTNKTITDTITQSAITDAAYLAASVTKLQTYPDVKQIVVVTHTVPEFALIHHDLELMDSYKINVMGNSLMTDVLAADTENKINTWCFGHYHSRVEQSINGIRYVNNCRGRGDSEWRQSVYYPLRIEVDI